MLTQTAELTASPRVESATATLELSIVMPCLNEAETLEGCIQKAAQALHAGQIAGEIIVADNGSTDGSAQIAEQCGVRVIQVTRSGYGAALRAGIAAARGRYVIMADSDASYDLAAISPFLEKLRAGVPLVSGTRTEQFGIVGDLPIVGDWDGDGADSPGVYRPASGQVILTNQVCSCQARIDYSFVITDQGESIRGSRPIAGDWDGDGLWDVGVVTYRTAQKDNLFYLNQGASNLDFVWGPLPNSSGDGAFPDLPVAGVWLQPTGALSAYREPTARPPLPPIVVRPPSAPTASPAVTPTPMPGGGHIFD